MVPAQRPKAVGQLRVAPEIEHDHFRLRRIGQRELVQIIGRDACHLHAGTQQELLDISIYAGEIELYRHLSPRYRASTAAFRNDDCPLIAGGWRLTTPG